MTESRITSRLTRMYNIISKARYDFETIKEEMCDDYCKWPEITLAMYKDVDEAQECLEQTKCDTCPLNKI